MFVEFGEICEKKNSVKLPEKTHKELMNAVARAPDMRYDGFGFDSYLKL